MPDSRGARWPAHQTPCIPRAGIFQGTGSGRARAVSSAQLSPAQSSVAVNVGKRTARLTGACRLNSFNTCWSTGLMSQASFQFGTVRPHLPGHRQIGFAGT